jgi:hypothetical protein
MEADHVTKQHGGSKYLADCVGTTGALAMTEYGARRIAATMLLPLVTIACAPMPPAPWNHPSEIIMNPDIAARFPGATILDEADFASTVTGRRFRYRVSNEIIIERPAESFSENERYSVGHRTIAQGTYSIKRGIVSIECSNCPETFFGLGRKRIFFRHQGRLLMANADAEGDVLELIPEFLKDDALRTLFSDAYVTPVQYPDVIRSHPPGEIFMSDGSYIRVGNRTRMYGTFNVRGNLVCVQGDGFRQQCRQVESMGNGTYSLTDISNRSSVQVTITPHK